MHDGLTSVAVVLMKLPEPRTEDRSLRPAPRGSRRGGTLWYVLVVAYAVLLIPAVSYVPALLCPGQGSVGACSACWPPEHRAEQLVEAGWAR